MRRRAKPTKAEVESKRPAVPKSPKSKDARVRDLEKRLAESLEQQTATAEILRVISSSPTDLETVFMAIVESAARLCNARFSALYRYDGELIHVAAHHNLAPEVLAILQRVYPLRPAPEVASGRAILSGAVVHLPDVLADPDYRHEMAIAGGWGSLLAVPMMKGDRAVGTINVYRAEAEPFPDSQIELLKTFANQAVIAIENVRLFKELEARNRDLTATSDILHVIASSPTDTQPVFNAIARSAMELCEGLNAYVFICDGEKYRPAALVNMSPEALLLMQRNFPLSPTRGSTWGRAILDRTVVHIRDVMTDPEYEFADVARADNFRSALAAPLLSEGVPIGAITVARRSPFSEKQIELVKTFADQAVIAIENVRLFTELQAKNRALTQAHAQVTEALEQQTATSEVLKVISQTPTSLQSVFEVIGDSAARLCHADIAGLFRVEGGQLNEVSSRSRLDPNFQERMRRVFPRPLDDSTHMGRALLERRLIHVADLTDPSAPPSAARLETFGFRAHLAVPMLRGGEPIGGLSMLRRTAGLFSDDQVQLLQTFADQAVIAIENARLLNELQARTGELTRSVEQLTALGEVGRAVSSTLELETVLTTIVSRAVELSRLDGGVVFEYDEGADEFVHRVATDVGGALAEARRTTRVRRGEGVVGQTALTLEPAQVPDITVPGAYESRLRDNLIESGVRAVLAVPMVREGELIGCLVVSRNRPGEFPAETIDLLRTFAIQSALAIQNARLFREIEQKSRELEAASRHKSEFLANMSHELRTPLNAIIGFSEVLSERMFGGLNEKQDEYLKDIHASGQHLLSLINDILDLSKIEAGRMELELSDFDLPMAIDSALTLIRERAARRSIALHTTVDERLGQMQGDERKIRQVLLNLLSNAIKFTPEGGRIEVAAKPVDGFIEVSVSDTGVGIAPEDQEAVFEEFKQVGMADKKVEGTGLGLALSRKFIELHGGKICVESQVGAGSTFTFTVPVRRGE
jgi:two-component system, NtrC family, sensor kinase